MIAAQPQQAPATYQSASLYVGDLHPEVTEGTLFDIFNRVGPVASIRVCRDAVTRRSLGYAYVNFHNVQDAERSLDTMNFTDIKGRPCRIMWSQRDPSLRKSGVGNVFVKSLPPTFDNKSLFDTFSVFGNILSCKVAMDENGVSKGYGYVHYETAEAAQDAIAKFKGNTIDEYEVYVGPFVRRQDRAGNVNWTNLYTKQFPTSWDEDKLKEVFGAYGTLASVFLMKDADGKSKGFGFVNYTEHEAAEKALKELANKSFPDPDGAEGATFELYVNRAQKRAERVREIKSKMEALKEDRVHKYQGMNLYVKNIDDSVTDELFKETFAKYGTITSARIMRDPNDQTSKGFGFVCFSNAEEAQRAAAELNNKLLRSKPITVAFHQRKELRRAQLAATYAPRGAGRFPQGGAVIPMPYMPMFAQPGQPNYQPGQPRAFYQGQQNYPRGAGAPRVPFAGAGGRGGNQGQGYYQGQGGRGGRGMVQAQQGMPAGGAPVAGMAPRPRGIPAAVPGQPVRGVAQPGRGGYMGVPAPQMVGVPAAGRVPVPGAPVSGVPVANGIQFNSNVRNQGLVQGGVQPMMGMMPPQAQPQPAAVTAVPLNEPLDDQALAAADPQMQKNMIGEKLYPLIYYTQPALAGKITGMLLEMDNAELLNLIESPEALQSKIEEALIVLKNHAAAGSAGEEQ